MKGIEVIEPGLLTTVQDLGRYGYQHIGMVVSGAMDHLSLQIANTLVGNKRDEGCLEITLSGPKLRFNLDTIIAITGADIEPKIDGKPVKTWCPLVINRGSILEFGTLKSGCRSYLAVSGGFRLPEVMGSYATYLRGRLGGYKGRALEKGDFIALNDPVINPYGFIPRWHFSQIKYPQKKVVRVIAGPEIDRFTPEGIEAFFNSNYEVTLLSDRMGYRLKGSVIESIDGNDIISDGVPFGTVQVTKDGMPIILMADRQTSGGYTRIATVITVDLPIIAQSKPGDIIHFKKVKVEEAQKMYLEMEKILGNLQQYFL